MDTMRVVGVLFLLLFGLEELLLLLLSLLLPTRTFAMTQVSLLPLGLLGAAMAFAAARARVSLRPQRARSRLWASCSLSYSGSDNLWSAPSIF